MSRPVLTVDGVDVSCVALPQVSVTVGRESVDTQPSASVLSARILGWAGAGEVGAPVVFSDTDGRMFGGAVTDLDCEHMTGDDWETRLVATGPLADLGRRVVGDVPWPEESDSARVARILTLADAPHAVDPDIVGPLVLARDVDSQPALMLAQGVADDALGVLWEQPADPVTPVRYLPARSRSWVTPSPSWAEVDDAVLWSGTGETTWADSAAVPGAQRPGELTIRCEECAADVTFSQRIGDVIRTVVLLYGPDAEPRASVVMGAGSPQRRVDTQLADLSGATEVAGALWRARHGVAWRLQGLRLRLDLLGAARRSQIRGALAVGTRLTVSLPVSSPVGTSWQGYVEGWDLDVDGDAQLLTLRVSDRSLTEPADMWADVPAGTTWADAGPVAWVDAIDFGGAV